MLTWRNKGAVHCLLNRSWGEPDLTASEEVQMRKGLLNAMLAVVLLSPVSIAQVQTDVVVIDRGPQTGVYGGVPLGLFRPSTWRLAQANFVD